MVQVLDKHSEYIKNNIEIISDEPGWRDLTAISGFITSKLLHEYGIKVKTTSVSLPGFIIDFFICIDANIDTIKVTDSEPTIETLDDIYEYISDNRLDGLTVCLELVSVNKLSIKLS